MENLNFSPVFSGIERFAVGFAQTTPMKLRPIFVIVLVFGLFVWIRPASASAVFAQASAQRKVDVNTNKKSRGFELPKRVIGGNAISVLMPVQVGFVGYMPRVRIGFQYDYQLYKRHWLFGGAAVLLDRGDFRTFRLNSCGIETNSVSNACQAGTVAGFDLWLGYAHKWFIQKHPYLVPIARGAVGGGWWKYPDVTGARLQSRESSWTLSLRGGGGLRFFLLDNLGIGLDVNLVIGFTRSKDRLAAMVASTHENRVLFGMEILPLIVEYRF